MNKLSEIYIILYLFLFCICQEEVYIQKNNIRKYLRKLDDDVK